MVKTLCVAYKYARNMRHWPVVIFCSTLNMSVLILMSKKKSRRLFLENLEYTSKNNQIENSGYL